MANITEDGNCTSNMSDIGSAQPAGILQFFSALNIFLSITASLGNALILVALHKVSSIHPPTKLFFQCLAVTDLCVGLIVQPLYATDIISRITKMNVNILHYLTMVLDVSGWILCAVSGLTSTAVSVDRLLALLLGLRYRHVVTIRRVSVIIICFWFIGASVGALRMWRRDIALKQVACLIITCLVTSIFCFTSIHFKLRHQQAQVHVPQGQPNGGGIPLNIARYKKSVSSIIWVQLALVACYVPFGIVAVLNGRGIENFLALLATETLVYLNSSLNPISYCWKIRAVKEAVKDTIKQLDCF
ncbi:melanocortin receptor 4-like [Oculina patagonica]